MSKPAQGARVQYCGHDGYFVADIYRVGSANVVVANDKVSPDNIIRPARPEATHHLNDYPFAGYWSPARGIFVVPQSQVVKISKA